MEQMFMKRMDMNWKRDDWKRNLKPAVKRSPEK
jgi:hypothetical protein